MMMAAGITPYSSTRTLWQSCQQRHLGQVGGVDEGVRILPISILNSSRDQVRFEPANLGSSTQYANHYTTEATDFSGTVRFTTIFTKARYMLPKLSWRIHLSSNLRLPGLRSDLFLFRSSNQTFVCISHILRACRSPRPFHRSFGQPNNICEEIVFPLYTVSPSVVMFSFQSQIILIITHALILRYSLRTRVRARACR
jgi:hypothetical protein